MSGRESTGKPLQNGAPARPVSNLAVFCAGLSDGTVSSVCGGMAGLASGIVTCPLDVIKTRLQAQGSFRRLMRPDAPTGAIYNGLIGTAKTIWVQDGIKGMYRGLGPMLLGYLPTWAVYMSVYDSSRNYWYDHVGK
jgi:solute carrier family 25 folate transporter 32